MFLIIDTSATPTLIALADKNKIIEEKVWEAGRNLSIDLLPAVDTLLNNQKIQGNKLEYLAVLTGPGSYTGLRIGVTLANALGYAWQIPVKGIGRFEVWESFYNLNTSGEDQIILDADHEKVFVRDMKEKKYWIGLPQGKTKQIKVAKVIYTDLIGEILKQLKDINSSVEIIKLSVKSQDILESIRNAATKQKNKKTFEAIQPLYIRPPAITIKKDAPRHK